MPSATIRPDGSIGEMPWDGVATPHDSIRGQVEEFEESWRSSELLRNLVSRELQAHPRTGYAGVRASKLVIVTGLLLHEAADRFYKGDFFVGKGVLDATRTLLDVASVVSPSFFLARELYQCVSGEDYLTGRQLSPSERGVDAWLTLVYRVQPVSIALTAASERDALSGAARTLDDILEDETAFDRWLGRKFPADRPYPDDAAQKIWDRLRAKGLDPQLDEGHSFGVWRGPHIHIEKDNVHIPVSTTFKPK